MNSLVHAAIRPAIGEGDRLESQSAETEDQVSTINPQFYFLSRVPNADKFNYICKAEMA